MSKLKKQFFIPVVVIIGLITLFFFPKPQANFLAYLATVVCFVVIIILLSKDTKNKKAQPNKRQKSKLKQ